MRTAVLIDTSSWVEALRADGNPEVRDRVAAVMRDGSACLCEIVLLELWSGVHGSRERADLERLAAAVPSLNIDATVWTYALALARKCRSQGVTVPATDLVVAACARRHGAEIEHTDDHFRLIEGAV